MRVRTITWTMSIPVQVGQRVGEIGPPTELAVLTTIQLLRCTYYVKIGLEKDGSSHSINLWA